MASDRAAPPSFCLEVDITQSGADVSAVSRGFEKLVSRPQSLGTRDVIGQFEQWVRSAAQRSAPLNPAVLAEDLHAALFQGEFLDALTTLRVAASGGQLLVRLIPHGRDLEATPWEALCRSAKRLDFLGTSQELLFVRGVHSTRPVKRSEVRTAVRMLVISPLDEDAPDLMRAELQSTIDSGHLEWMEPLTGPRARWDFVRKQLIREPVPHIIHFIGHGSASPSLQLAEEDGRESWLKVELLARLLEPTAATWRAASTPRASACWSASRRAPRPSLPSCTCATETPFSSTSSTASRCLPGPGWMRRRPRCASCWS
jgi:hypothetical protein